MEIVKNKNDSNYRFTIKDTWGGGMSCTLDDLEDLAFEIERVLKQEKAEMQVTVKPAQVKMDWFN